MNHKKWIGSVFIAMLTLTVTVLNVLANGKPVKKVVIGYVGGYNGIFDVSMIDANKLTHINYAFVDIKNGEAWLHNEATDTVNFRMLNSLKKINPSLKILISIGGWAWSENFSDAVLTEAARKKFAASAVDIMEKYHLDGVDIDWEYPAMPGEEGNVYRPEDTRNFTLMFKALREALDEAGKKDGQHYLLTAAVGASTRNVETTEMDQVATYMDYINLMTYDYKTGGSKIAGHHANLYGSTDNPDESSADRSVKAYIAAGVPPSKIVLGLAFYGRAWKMPSGKNLGLNETPESAAWGGGYTKIKDTLMKTGGYKYYWDKKAQAPYLFNENDKIFITMDDEKSVKIKCKYVRKNGLAGVMFWEYSSDPKGYLLTTVHNNL